MGDKELGVWKEPGRVMNIRDEKGFVDVWMNWNVWGMGEVGVGE